LPGCFSSISPNPLFARHYEDPVLFLHRRRRHEAQGGHGRRREQYGGHRPGGHERPTTPVLRGRTAVSSWTTWPCRTTTPRLLEQIVEGISAGCIESDCALLGGETAIMPGPVRPGRLRPGWLLRRRGRAASGHRWPGDHAGATSSSALPRAVCTERLQPGWRKIAFEDRRPQNPTTTSPNWARRFGQACSRPRASTPGPCASCSPITGSRAWCMASLTSPRRAGMRTWNGFCQRARKGGNRAGSWQVPPGLQVAPAFGRGRANGDGAGLQHGIGLCWS